MTGAHGYPNAPLTSFLFPAPAPTPVEGVFEKLPRPFCGVLFFISSFRASTTCGEGERTP